MKKIYLTIEEQIISIVNDSFDECISSNAYESFEGLHSEILGREDFIKRVSELIQTKLSKYN